MFIDTHCHLFPEFNFVTKIPEQIVEESLSIGVKEMWLASTEKADILWNLEFCKKYPKNLKTWVGWHPEKYLSYDNNFLSSLLEINNTVQNPKSKFLMTNENTNTKYQILDTTIVGIGEIGLDFAAHPKSTKDVQVKVFESQLKIAEQFNLPVSIHCRDAFEETINVMANYPNIKYLWHCFNLSSEKTKVLFNLFKNIYIGLNAIFTYKSGEYIKESLKFVPIHRILIETDAPFLAPRPFKYSHNTPEGVIAVYKAVSNFFSVDLSNLQSIILDNSLRLCQNSKLKNQSQI